MPINATKTITQLPSAIDEFVDDTAVIPIDDTEGTTRKMPLSMVRAKLGNLSLTGDVTAPPAPYGMLVTTIAARAVTLGKIVAINTNRLLGRSAAGTGDVQEIVVGDGLVLSAGVLSASSPASAAPSATLLTHRTFGSF
jgi:hypothetical protein